MVYQKARTSVSTSQYIHHLEAAFGELAKNASIDCEFIIKDHVGEPRFNHLKETYTNYLTSNPQGAGIGTKLIIADDVIIHVLGIYSLDEVRQIPDQYHLFYPICTVDEIMRIMTPKNTDDLLLIDRGVAAAEHVRLHRVLLAKYNKNPKHWSLSSYFNASDFEYFLECLSPKERAKCNITAGFAFTTEPNGSCIKSRYGNYIVVSEALRYFLYFMNVFYFGHGVSLPDRMTCLLIAARVMMYIEQLDFDLDPRGFIPPKTEQIVKFVTNNQMQFVIGHEYYHHILGHLDDKSTTLLGIQAGDSPVTVFNYSQQQELDADFAAIHRPRYSKTERSNLVDAAIMFFISLDMYSCIKEYCLPSVQHYKTHPDPLDRLRILRSKISCKFGMEPARINEFLDWNEKAKEHLLKEWLPFNIDDFETKGSFYLSTYKPGANIDRVHY